MAQFPGALLPWIERQFNDANGEPLSGGKLRSYVAGTSTPLATYSDALLTVANQVEIVLDADGRTPDPVRLLPQGYKFVLLDADDVEQYTYDDVTPPTLFADLFGRVMAEGSKDVNTGYQVLLTDRFVTVDATEVTDPCVLTLPTASDATQAVAIKNMAAVVVEVTPAGSDTIESIAGAYSVPAAASPNFPTIELVSDGVSAWLIRSSHGL
jgi:hypothetical protein